MLDLTVLSPAKINLMLRVLGRRADGYHELQTCFQLLNWGDFMHFSSDEVEQTAAVTVKGDFQGLCQTDNLITRAADLLKPYASRAVQVNITVVKNIPQGSGLGGASSNAAQTLVMLNKIWACGRSEEQLHKIGLSLGADVPVFLLGKSAIARGIGEALEACDFGLHHIVLFFPPLAISTREVFADPQLKRDQRVLSNQQVKNSDSWINDCLSVVLQKYPEMDQLYRKLSAYTSIRMSGTGSTFFALFDDKPTAMKCQKQCKKLLKTQYVLVQ